MPERGERPVTVTEGEATCPKCGQVTDITKLISGNVCPNCFRSVRSVSQPQPVSSVTPAPEPQPRTTPPTQTRFRLRREHYVRATLLALMVPLVLTFAMPRVFVAQSRSSLSSLHSLEAIQGKIDSLAKSTGLANSDIVRRDLERLYAVTSQGEGRAGIVGFASGVLGGVCLGIMYLNSLRGTKIAVRANFASVLVIVSVVVVNLSAVRYARVEAATTLAGSTERLGSVMGQIQLAAITSRDESLATQLLLFTADQPETNDNGDTALHLAADRGMVKLTTETLRRRKMNADVRDGNDATPLMRASAAAQPEIVSLLLKAEADPTATDDRNRTPLHHDAEARRSDIVKTLLDSGADIDARDAAGRTALSIAYAQSDHDLFAALVDRGAQVGATEEGARLAHDATAEAIKAIERSRDDDLNAGRGEIDRLRQLLIQGANPNAVLDGVGTPLHRVAKAVAALPEGAQRTLALGRVAQTLLDAGADPGTKNSDGRAAYDITYAARFGHADRVEHYCRDDAQAASRRGLYGKTALVVAVESNQLDVVRVLMEHGVGPDAWAGGGRTPIETAVLNGSDELVLLLLKHGFATPNDKSPLGGPLHFAAKDGRVGLIEPMLSAGYVVTTKDSRGNTPLHLASAAGHAEFAIQLVAHGADPLTWNNSGETPPSLSDSNGVKELHTYLKRSTQKSPAS